MITNNYPSGLNKDDALKPMAEAIEEFFLTDYCEEEDKDNAPLHSSMTPMSTAKKHRKDRSKGSGLLAEIGGLFGDNKKEKDKQRATESVGVTFASPPVVPRTKKTRRSIAVRTEEEEELKSSLPTLDADDDDEDKKGSITSPTKKVTTITPAPAVTAPPAAPFSAFFANNPYAVVVAVAIVLGVLRRAQFTSVTLDSDVAMLISFACFCFGLNWPRPAPPPVVVRKPVTAKAKAAARRRTIMAASRAAAPTPTNRQLLRASMMTSPTVAEAAQSVRQMDELGVLDEEGEEEEEEGPLIKSPMDTYPEGAPLGEYFNCVSEPDCETFHIRGPNYFSDKIKVPSEPFLFRCRGVDLFLTDDPPENVGRNPGCMGGHLRDVPTFIINFRLPWGVLIFYSEIPEKFVPFMRSCYDPFFDEKLPSLDDMTPGERTLARWLEGDEEYKNNRLKIVPVAVVAPWLVKSVVGGKPAIVGTKMPIQYVYGPRVGDKAEYLEADLDIVASAVARKICSVVVNATQGLTLDLGFEIESQTEDELPEQMLLATRLHGIDPISAPSLPPMKDMFMVDDDVPIIVNEGPKQ